MLRLRAWIFYFLYNLIYVIQISIGRAKIDQDLCGALDADGESYCKADGCNYDRELITPERISNMRIVYRVFIYAAMLHSLLIYWFPRLQTFILF